MLPLSFIANASLLTPDAEPLQPPLLSFANALFSLLCFQHLLPGQGHWHAQRTLPTLCSLPTLSALIAAYPHSKAKKLSDSKALISAPVLQEVDAKTGLNM